MIINSLEVGGAETSLESLCMPLSNSFKIEIITLSGAGEISQRLRDKNFRVHELEFSKSFLPLKECFKLFKLIKSINPDIVHTWMYHSNFFGGIIAKLLRIRKIIWSVHAFNISPGMLKPGTRLLIKLLGYLSHIIPHHVICCSQESLKVHEKLYYSKKKMLFIPNGVNTEKFKYSQIFRDEIRSELNMDEKKIYVGCIGRYDIQKNQIGFLKIASKILQSNKNYHFILVGRGNDLKNSELLKAINELKLEKDITLLGERSDIVKILSALDIFALPSKGEAFPVSLCEAMACQLLCATTSVGDINLILGGVIKTIDLDKFELLSDLIIELGEMNTYERNKKGKAMRARVLENFSISTIANAHKEIYENA